MIILIQTITEEMQRGLLRLTAREIWSSIHATTYARGADPTSLNMDTPNAMLEDCASTKEFITLHSPSIMPSLPLGSRSKPMTSPPTAYLASDFCLPPSQ